MFEFLCLTNLNFKGRVRRRTKSGWEIARQADRLAQQRYGSNFDNPNNLVNRIQAGILETSIEMEPVGIHKFQNVLTWDLMMGN